MHVLAIGTLTGKDIEPHLPAEAEHVNKLREEGLIRFLKADRSGPIIFLNDVDASEASERLASLPFITEGLATFDFVELFTLAEAQERRRAQGSA
jgi:hypothetical protein